MNKKKNKKNIIKIATDFGSGNPDINDDLDDKLTTKGNGIRFMNDFILPALKKSTKNNPLIIDLDGASFYSAAFLEGAFKYIVKDGHYTKEQLKDLLKIKASNGWLTYKEIIMDYINNK